MGFSGASTSSHAGVPAVSETLYEETLTTLRHQAGALLVLESAIPWTCYQIDIKTLKNYLPTAYNFFGALLPASLFTSRRDGRSTVRSSMMHSRQGWKIAGLQAIYR
jgi:hypothetical protein